MFISKGKWAASSPSIIPRTITRVTQKTYNMVFIDLEERQALINIIGKIWKHSSSTYYTRTWDVVVHRANIHEGLLCPSRKLFSYIWILGKTKWWSLLLWEDRESEAKLPRVRPCPKPHLFVPCINMLQVHPLWFIKDMFIVTAMHVMSITADTQSIKISLIEGHTISA
jgi:hypothetical protein